MVHFLRWFSCEEWCPESKATTTTTTATAAAAFSTHSLGDRHQIKNRDTKPECCELWKNYLISYWEHLGTGICMETVYVMDTCWSNGRLCGSTPLASKFHCVNSYRPNSGGSFLTAQKWPISHPGPRIPKWDRKMLWRCLNKVNYKNLTRYDDQFLE